MKRRRIAILVLIVAGVALVSYFANRPAPDRNTLQVSGNFEISDVEVSFKLPGRVVARAVSEGESVTAGFAGESVTLSSEYVLDERPERIVVLGGAGFDADSLAAAQPTWAGLPALTTGRVCGIDADLVSRPGPRLVDGVEALRACIGRAAVRRAPPADA